MEQHQHSKQEAMTRSELTSMVLGAGFALASLILIPAAAQRMGVGSSLTSALRVALMRASQRA